ncbi:ubiquinone biosynthesis regulatory protein kinase UbiB [Candidatus Thioglobus sp. NP1]|uniref:ubiquinone biosynthesis regulatory protein kinase UbiB n=1 Tax=Candidatus Thioglobus sp. NP1 TaxID=2508687 RepID=UPI000DEE0A59|nr:ubiquinone biosynthesis regulatory protein kinase UbiB [Candidatus Thioglobus sp. NP1]AXE61316.1 ubiquinone biosynthesis regulatory protein kinase UbiB [Candidatus Thioglobus sp. NP1]
MRNFFQFLRILRTLIKYRLDYLILSSSLLKSFKPLVYLTPWHYFPSKKLSRGERIRLALEELGPVFIKFGQTLSTRRDLLPDDIGDELAKLQDTCPPFSEKESKSIIEKNLGSSVGELFKSFDDKPLASASIAQVHTATTHNNEEIIIKVVRPGIEKLIKRDVGLLYAFASLAESHPIGKRLRPKEVIEEFEGIIYNELNMMIEAANASLLGKNFSDSDLLYVPKVHWEFCRSNILVTERIYGTPVNNIEALIENKTDLKVLAENGVIIFFTQVFDHNFFHADMHPGNIFVGKNDQYTGVDFGIMGTLSEEDQYFLAQNFLAFFNQDYKRVAQVHLESGWIPEGTNVLEFENAIRSVCEPIFQKPLNEISFAQVLLSLAKEARRFDMTIQPQLLLLYKTLFNIEGLGRTLYPNLDLWATAKPYLEKLTKDKYSIKGSLKKISDKLPELVSELPELPMLVINALKQIESGAHKQENSKKQTEAIISQLQSNLSKQRSAIFAASLVILAGILATQSMWLFAGVSSSLSFLIWLRSR